MKKDLFILIVAGLLVPAAKAGILQRGKVQLICHRTANRDMPESTLDALALAARMGCNVVEVDIRRTADGQLVLNHDGMLERLTEAMGDVESTSYDELKLLDTGAAMSGRFAHMRIPLFVDALRVAREQGIGLLLDIKDKGEGPAILAALRQEGMLERVIFGGKSDDVLALYPEANRDPVAWLDPGCTAVQVEALHAQGRFVVVNFSANAYEMDMPSMRKAVAAGVDAINVDYPRLGADAVGRPVEAKLAALASAASSGKEESRVRAVRELSYYEGFPTQKLFLRWLHDPDDQISRAAAVALVTARPAISADVFTRALSAREMTARKNAAWALGMIGAPCSPGLLALLQDKDAVVLREALLALSRCQGDVPADILLPFLKNRTPTVRGAAALALARHQPEVAAHAIPELLNQEEKEIAEDYARYVSRGKPKLTQAEIDPIVETYREQMKLVHSLELLSPEDALHSLAGQAFRPVSDYSQVTALLAGYQLWDRIAADPALAIQALGSTDEVVADRAEWMLVKAGPAVLQDVRHALPISSPSVQERLIRIVAWQGDNRALSLLHELSLSRPQEKVLIDWAIHKIEVLGFES
ncbi:glycerophosphodiester phosphodiesterase family protein [Edaphobacter sp.]|uniref:glycerophosphodiester phosphodiesterase family protein n=1 Tax=Edaphobacter sp. TaxID=1934404 RepID=UPI002DB8CFE7|nr:glycerophosphodiester phosphodiesterase family protein [Edaphobacter sp.]HEU5340890.1 glycerophosphodiester phosphodiesterase family protein [Edaphobacter sp.]